MAITPRRHMHHRASWQAWISNRETAGHDGTRHRAPGAMVVRSAPRGFPGRGAREMRRVPTPLAPELPTVAAAGVPGYEAIQVLGVFAPARTPAALIGQLNQEIVRAGASTHTHYPAQGQSVYSRPRLSWICVRAHNARSNSLWAGPLPSQAGVSFPPTDDLMPRAVSCAAIYPLESPCPPVS